MERKKAGSGFKMKSPIKEYVSDAQRKAVHASKAEKASGLKNIFSGLGQQLGTKGAFGLARGMM